MPRISAVLPVFLMYSLQIVAQDRDSAKLYRPDCRPSHVFKAKQLILPASLITYGILSLNSPALQDVNKWGQEHISNPSSSGEFAVENILVFAPAAMVYGLNLAGYKGRHDLADRSFLLAISLGISAATVEISKRISKEWRPNGEDDKSFPSAHTSAAFASAEFLRMEYGARSPWIVASGYGMALATAYLRVYHNKHWLGDVIAGAGYGILSTRISYWIYPHISRMAGSRKIHAILFPSWNGKGLSLNYARTF